MSIKKIFFYLIFVSFVTNNIQAEILIPTPDNLSVPTYKEYEKNREYIFPFKYKKITVWEYVTDPLILYASLWGCFALTIPIWEHDPERTEWEPDAHRGFKELVTPSGDETVNEAFGRVYLSRFAMEPFASGRIAPITKEENGLTVLRSDFYVKNIIEPVYFTYLVLYLRAKNYHPAILITEIILLSLLYEMTIRPFYLNASFEQFLKNPAIGIAVGILFDEISTFLLTTPYIGLHVLAYIFNPFNALPNARIKPLLMFDPYQRKARIEAIIKL